MGFSSSLFTIIKSRSIVTLKKKYEYCEWGSWSVANRNSYLFNSFSLFGCETNRSNCEWLVFPKSRGIRENGLENPYFEISRRRRRREILNGFERPFSLIPSDLGETSFTVRKVCRTPKKGQMNWTDNFLKFFQYFRVIVNTLLGW